MAQATALVAAAACGPVWATGTPAGTVIVNEASVTYDTGGVPATASSNPTNLTVDERLDVAVASNDAGGVTVPSPALARVLSFTVTNVGNGVEAFVLSVDGAIAGDQYDPTNLRIFLDSNGDGVFNPVTDALYLPGNNEPQLDPDQSVIVFVVGDTVAGLLNGSIGRAELEAAAQTGNGAPGTTFAGLGDGGSDAVAGASTALADALAYYEVAAAETALLKTQSVLDPDGGSNPVPGAVITYTLALTVNNGSVANAVITDPIPANTTYVAGSLRLDDAPLTDAVDADAGSFLLAAIAVQLGDVVGPATRTVQFSVLIP